MPTDEVIVEDPDGLASVVFRWLPEGETRAVLHLLHGWGEHAMRYDRFATKLAGAGFAVWADDHRGHGQTGVRSETLGDLGPRGMDGVLDAVRAVSVQVIVDHRGLPFFMLGHSWGSFILQRYLRRWSSDMAGGILTGTTYRDPNAPPAERRPPNERFEPARTPYDWLTRDEAEVDTYIADPLCGFEVMRRPPGGSPSTPQEEPSGRDPMTTTLPVLVLNGADDPIGGDEGGRALAEHYRSLGLADVTFRSWPGARHELLNETCRDEVEAEIVGWLERRVAALTPR